MIQYIGAPRVDTRTCCTRHS